MKVEEFKAFLTDHLKRFPQLKKEGVDKDSWWAALKPFSKDIADDASGMMLSGEIKRPYYASDHVALIVSYCRAARSTGHQLHAIKEAGVGVACCDQTGVRFIYNPADIMRLLVFRFPDKFEEIITNKYAAAEEIECRTQTVACDCEVGVAKFPRDRENPWPVLGDRWWHIEAANLTCDEIVNAFLLKEKKHAVGN